MELIMKEFLVNEIKLRCLFCSPFLGGCKNIPVPSNKIKAVYEDELRFPEYPSDRPYIFASFVTSIDGKLAYVDEPSAFYVAAKNRYAAGGKDADFWILNALRGVCDGALIGGNSLATDSDYAMYTMDIEIQQDREKSGLSKIPINIIASLDATDIPLEHMILKNREIPCLIVTSPFGYDYLKNNYDGQIILMEEKNKRKDLWGNGILPVLVTGEDNKTDSQKIMRFLKRNGINRLLIESPGYGHHLIKEGLLDEMFLNISSVYIGGGDSMTLGKTDQAFSAEKHPHVQLLSIHIYNEYFTYYRYRFHYEYM